MIYEENIERMDFLEIILSPKECERISLKGVVKDFPGGLHGKRDLNVYVRVDPNYEEEEILDAISKREKSKNKKGVL